MTPNPVSILAGASIKEAAATMIDHHFSALPVINEAGRPIGVISQTDIVRYERERVDYAQTMPEHVSAGYQVERTDAPAVREIMTPFVYSVKPTAPAEAVVAEMVARKVHRLFVVDEAGVLVGVISAFDVVRRMAG